MDPSPVRAAPTPPSAPQPALRPTPASSWLVELEHEVQAHAAVNHHLLARLTDDDATRADALAFGLQHHALVGCFTRYMELLLLHAPSSQEKLWLAKVLVNEYGEGSDGRDHTTLYGEFLSAAGAAPDEPARTPLCVEAWDFIDTHLRLCRREPYLVGLGALGPGHEWAIPTMFHQLIPGLQRLGFSAEQRLYFDLHTEQDIDHGAWMTEVLDTLVTSEADRELVRRGARLSLDARARFWTGVERTLLAKRDGASASTADSPGDLRALRPAVNAVIEGRAEHLIDAVRLAAPER